MKIAMTLFKYFPFGGLQRDFMRMADECVKRGHQVTTFAGAWQGDKPDWLDLRIIPLESRSNHGKGREFEKRFGEILEKEHFDVVVGFNRMAYLDFYFAADNCLLISDRAKHSALMLALNPRYRAWHKQERAVMDPAGKAIIMYITPRQKDDYIAVYGTPEARFRYIPPGIDTACRRPANAVEIRAAKRAELGLKDDELLLILVGSDFRRKGGDRLVRATAQLPPELRKRCQVYLVGNCGPGGCDALAQKLGIAEQVVLTGGRTDVPALLLAADLMVHPARDEATGTVLVEALAAGLPVLCTETCGFSNFVRDSGGIVVASEPFDQHELDAKLTAALQPETLSALTKQALEYGERTDFYRRAAVAADLFEEKYHEEVDRPDVGVDGRGSARMVRRGVKNNV